MWSEVKITDLQKSCHNTAKEKGFWEDSNPNDGERLALMHSEISECLEALRHDNPKSNKIEAGNAEEELADCIIRILDFAEYKGWDMENIIKLKMLYNKGREYKHGKKF